MNIKARFNIARLAVLSAITSQLAAVYGQGILTPPGAPAPTMKTLSQIEPRTPISSAPYIITNPGSYYLTTNISVSSGDAIEINNVTNVTVDLNGFALYSTEASPSGRGIALLGPGLANITIINGLIRGNVTNVGSVYGGSGFYSGINDPYGTAVNVRVSGVSVSGCLGTGISLPGYDSCVVESCSVRTVGGPGVVAKVIRKCVAYNCAFTALGADEVDDSRGECSGFSSGIFASTVKNCLGTSSAGAGISSQIVENSFGKSYAQGDGIQAGNIQNSYGGSASGNGITVSGTAHNCTGQSGSVGIYAYSYSTLANCTGSGSGVGIHSDNHCTIENCNACGDLTNGIVVGQGCTVQGCTANGNGTGSAGTGISTGIRCLVEECVANDNGGDGILAAGDSTVQNNHASHNGLGGTGSGIHATGSGSRIEGNHTRDNATYGVRSDGGPNADVIIRNSSGNNGIGSFTPVTGNTFAPVQSPAAATNPMANMSF